MPIDTRKSFPHKVPNPASPILNATTLPEGLTRPYIAIEGPMGVGKTSLARLLRDRWNCEVMLEDYEQNPFLTRGFYQDRKAYGFNTEIFFLLSRYRQQEALARAVEATVSDYLFDKNWIFAAMNLEGVDREIFKITYDNFSKTIRVPDLVILLEADLETILRRIYFRDREFERDISPAYLERLCFEYTRFFRTFSKAPVLKISTNKLDFVKDPEDFEKIALAVEERLLGLEQLSFAPRMKQAHV